MAVKINGKLQGEDAQEQFRLEKKRFDMKQKRREYEQAKKREELLKLGEGNKKLF